MSSFAPPASNALKFPEIQDSKKITNFWVGTGVFLIITLLVSIIMPIYVTYNTNDAKQIPTNRR